MSFKTNANRSGNVKKIFSKKKPERREIETVAADKTLEEMGLC